MVNPRTNRVGARRVQSALQSLTLRLFVLLFGVTIAAFAAYAYLSFRSTSAQWEQTVHAGAHRFSDLIQRSTHYAMLLNRKEDVYNTIRTIAEEPGVEGVRVYNKNGEIIFSAADSEIGSRVDLQGEACVSCHRGPVPLVGVPEGRRVRVFRRADGRRVLGLINPIENATECSTASCHAHPPEQRILGVLDVTMSMAEPDARLALARRQAVVAAVLIASLAGVFSAAFIHLVVRRPVNRLIRGAARVAGGDLDTEIDVRSGHEIGQLAAAFNSMTRDLRTARRDLTSWSKRLEVALQQKTEELSRTQREVAHMEKMASLGKLAATVAHELNNPLAGILNYAKLIDRTLRESDATVPEQQELARYLQLIQKEAGRSGVIVRNLLLFARRSGADLAVHALRPILDRSLMLMRHHLEMSSIRLETSPLAGDDRLVCDADQIQQALVALLVNAVEAMPNGGSLTVEATGDEDSIRLRVSDTGVGIPERDLPNIFEPFFSSKEDTEGAGLGLAVVYGIVRRHGGRIDVDSELGRGTTFTITLPRRAESGAEQKTEQTVEAAAAPLGES